LPLPTPRDLQADPPQRAQSPEALTQLVHQLNRAATSSDAFSIFAEALESMFPGLGNVSLLLLPSQKQGEAPPAAPLAPPPAPLQPSLTTAAPRKGGKGGKAADAPPGADTQGCDWSFAALFHLCKGRGAVVQPQPPWPLVCSAAHHAALVADGVVTTPDYRRAVRFAAARKPLSRSLPTHSLARPSHSTHSPLTPPLPTHALPSLLTNTLELTPTRLGPALPRLAGAGGGGQREHGGGAYLLLEAPGGGADARIA